MSRVDEALRRAARMNEGLGHVEDTRVTIDPAGLDRYDPETSERDRSIAEKPVRSAELRIPRLLSVPAAPAVEKALRPFQIPQAQACRLVVSQDVPHFVVEQYRRLAAVLNDLQAQRGVKTLMVSSAAPREGKTLTVTNLALTLSESYHQRVLLIDADLRRPSVHEVLGIRNSSGLVDVVRSGIVSFPTFRVTSHLDVLTAGHTDDSLLALLASDKLRNAIVQAAAEFDWVLLDTPPVGLLPDAQLVARICEAVLFVIGAGVAPYEFVQRSVAALGPERIVGTVLNRIEDTRHTRSDDYYSYRPTVSVTSSGSH
jgi:succinoglycan biosynthesis transport protein ExoP